MRINGQDEISRRAIVCGALGALVPRALRARSTSTAAHIHSAPAGATLQQPDPIQDPSVGQLGNPWVAGQPRNRPTDFDNDPYIIELENQLKCTCGCAHSLYACRTTDFNCGYWQALHAEVIEMVKRDMPAEEIIEAYVSKYGTEYLMAPPPEGFNLAGYLVPGVLISLVAAGMVWVLQRKSRLSEAPVEVTPDAPEAISEEDEARLVAELEKLRR